MNVVRDLWNQDDAEEGRGRQAQQNNRSSDGTKENMEEPKVAKLPEPRNSSIKKGDYQFTLSMPSDAGLWLLQVFRRLPLKE